MAGAGGAAAGAAALQRMSLRRRIENSTDWVPVNAVFSTHGSSCCMWLRPYSVPLLRFRLRGERETDSWHSSILSLSLSRQSDRRFLRISRWIR